MRLKPSLSALLFFCIFPFHTYANTEQSASATRMTSVLEVFDTHSLFEMSDCPTQLAALSPHEMKETEGAWGLWGAAAGVLGAGLGYTYNSYITRSPWSWGNFGLSVGLGFSSGAFAEIGRAHV